MPITSTVVKQLARSSILLVLLLTATARAFAGDVSVAWDPVADAIVVGYKVYFGPAAGNYIFNLEVGNTTTYTVASLVEGQTYHFAVTAYNATHSESAFSNDVSATVAYGAPVANFSAGTSTGIAPLALNFMNTSTGTISTYTWRFGDGTTSSVQNPTHVYSTAGLYNVSLTVTGPGGADTKLWRYRFF